MYERWRVGATIRLVDLLRFLMEFDLLGFGLVLRQTATVEIIWNFQRHLKQVLDTQFFDETERFRRKTLTRPSQDVSS